MRGRYYVAPGVEAQLCPVCILRSLKPEEVETVAARRGRQPSQDDPIVVGHAEWQTFQPHAREVQ